jgi:ankyrin repeat protein
MYAVMNQHKEMVSRLIELGSNVKARDRYGETALHFAANRQGKGTTEPNIEIVKLLLNHGADINAVTNDGESVLYLAIMEFRNPIAKYLLDQGALVNPRRPKSKIPLALAVHWGHDDVITLLFERGAKVNLIDREGNSSLLKACENVSSAHASTVMLLLQHGANIEQQDSDGNTPLMRASAQKLDPEIVHVLLEAGAKVNHLNKNGEDALLFSIKENIPPIKLIRDDFNSIIRDLIAHGANAKRKDRKGMTAADYAKSHNLVELQKILSSVQENKAP